MLTLTGIDTVAHYQTALRAVTYTNTSESPDETTRILTFIATDASGGSSIAETRNITITAVADVTTVDLDASNTANNDYATIFY